jgi:hypothetical protein
MKKAALFSTGIALGLFTGLLVGMSLSPVVTSLLSLLLAVSTAWLLTHETDKTDLRKDSFIRLSGFCMGGFVAVILGAYIKAENPLAPSLSKQVAEWREAGFKTSEALAIVRYLNSGLIDAGDQVKALPVPDTFQRTPFALYSSSPGQHNKLNPKTSFKSYSEAKQEYEKSGSAYIDMINLVDNNFKESTDIEKHNLLYCLWIHHSIINYKHQ